MSAAKGIGQQTGGSITDNKLEAARILDLILTVPYDKLEDELNQWQLQFIDDIRSLLRRGSAVTGKQIFKLRETKDELVEKGIL